MQASDLARRRSPAYLAGSVAMALALGAAAGCPRDSQLVDNGKVLVFHQQQEPDALNALISDMVATSDALRPIQEGLVTVTDRLEVVPVLAMEIPTVENGGVVVQGDRMVVTWQLREGVTWHDGQPFTADDVKFTWEVIMHPKTRVTSRDGFDKIDRIEILGPHRIRLHFKQIYAPHDLLFSGGGAILPRHVLERYLQDPNGDSINQAPFNRAPIGTGPFKFKEWVSGDHIAMVANERYWRGRPKLDALRMRIVPDENAAFTLLKSGELDLYQSASINQYEALRKLAHVRLEPTASLTWEHLDFNLGRPVFQDLRVRRAIAHAINKRQISEKIYQGLYAVAHSDLAPLSWAYNKGVEERYPFDPARARALLDEAGWRPGLDGIRVKDGKRFVIKISTTAGRKTRELTELVLKYYLKKVGIELLIDNHPGPILFGGHPSGILKGFKFDLGMSAWSAGPDPDNFALWHSSQIPPAGQNHVQFRNKEMDALLEQGTRSIRRADRARIYARTAEILADELPMIPLLYWSQLDPVSKRLRHFKPNPSSAGNLWNVHEWEVVPLQQALAEPAVEKKE
ncbi:MAG: peptide ABC transporter substrate-binding protein [Candidatus Sericytochromatia bacterium]|nr:peptide ABC transporter substrate-binding protein [Candidatus Sericytochromatia bacterium]